MNKPTLGAGSLALVGLLFIGIALLANTLLRGAQLDLTEDRLYTLSDGTRNILRGLKEPVNLYLFFSDRTATPIPEIKNYGTRVRELLESMASRSNGKLTLRVIDPQPFSEEEDRATELGIQGMPINAGGEKLYLGLAGTNSTDGKEAIPFLDPKLDEQLEYDVAKLVHKLSSARKPVVGWMSSLPMGGEFDMRTGRPGPTLMVYAQAEQLYAVRTIDPSVTSIDADVDVLVLVHPKNLSPAGAVRHRSIRDARRTRAGVRRSERAGGPVGRRPQQSDGADDGRQVLASRTAARLLGRGVQGRPGGRGPGARPGGRHRARANRLRSTSRSSGFDNSSVSKDVITAQLDSINMATAGSLKPLSDNKAGSKLKFEPLIHTSAQAGLLPAQRLAMMADASSLRDGFRPTGQFVVAARVSGDATSAYAAGPPEGVTAAPEALKASAKPLNVIVIADSDLLSDFMWGQQANFFGQAIFQPFANNGELVWNALDNLAGSNDLISIRGRASYSRPFDRVDDLRREADAQFRAKEMQLRDRAHPDRGDPGQAAEHNRAAAKPYSRRTSAREIERFRQEQLRMRKELRAVKAGLESDIKSLGTWIKVINILLVPLLFACLALLVASWHRRRRHAIAMLRKGASA